MAKTTLVAGTYFSNVATPGLTCQQMSDRYTTSIAPLYDSHRTRNVASIMCGANNNGSDLDSYNAILTWVASAKATGFNVVVFTMLSRVSLDSFKNALNTRIRNGAVANGYTVADSGSDPNMGCDGCYANLTYFQADQVHPTLAGQVIVANPYAEAALATLGFQ